MAQLNLRRGMDPREAEVMMEKKKEVPMEDPHKCKAMRTLTRRVGKPTAKRTVKRHCE